MNPNAGSAFPAVTLATGPANGTGYGEYTVHVVTSTAGTLSMTADTGSSSNNSTVTVNAGSGITVFPTV